MVWSYITPPHFHCLSSCETTKFAPPPHFHCLSSTTTTTFPLSFIHCRHHMSVVFPPPPPPHFHFLSSTITGDRNYHSSVIFPPPLPLHFYDFHTFIATTTTYCRTSINATSAITLLLFFPYPHSPSFSTL